MALSLQDTLYQIFAISTADDSDLSSLDTSNIIDEELQIATIHALQNIKNVITEHDILEAISNDPTYASLIQTINHGFPNKKHDTPLELKVY